MKNIFKSTLKIVLVFTLMLSAGCEKEIYEPNIKQNNRKIQHRTLTGEKAIVVANRLIGILNRNNISIDMGQGKTATEIEQSSIGTIKYDEIKEVIDTLGKTNYTFRVEHPQSDDKTFFNLLLQEKDGYSSVKLLKYVMTEEFANLYKQNFKLDNFKGTISSEIIISDTPCPEVGFTVIIGSPPTNSAGGSDLPPIHTPNQPPPPFDYGAPPLVVIIHIGGPDSSGGDSSDNPTTTTNPDDPDGPKDHYHQVYIKMSQNIGVNPGADIPCPEDTVFGVLNPIDDCSRAFMAELPYDQRVWLYNEQTNNSPFFSEILNYVARDESGCSPEKNSIGKQMLDAMKNKGEADLIYKVIIDSTLKKNPCLYGVYSQLGKASTFQNYLHNFDGDFSVANLRLNVGVDSDSPNANAVTTEPQNYLINIMFNPNKLSRPQLDIARTFIHELIHAEIFRKLLSLAGQPNIPWTKEFIISIKNDYPGLYDYYMRYKFNIAPGQQPSDVQHQLMAQNYRDVIIQVLQQFDNNQTTETYNALSWSGLMGTGTINQATGLGTNPTVAWANVPLSERLQIINIRNNFLNSNPPCQP